MNLNLYLAALLVIGLTPQSSFDNYFKEDADGIFGSTWMQQHFTRHNTGINELLLLINSDQDWNFIVLQILNIICGIYGFIREKNQLEFIHLVK